MSENGIELIGMIRENDDPNRALLIATEVILDFLAQHGSSEERVSAGLQAHG